MRNLMYICRKSSDKRTMYQAVQNPPPPSEIPPLGKDRETHQKKTYSLRQMEGGTNLPRRGSSNALAHGPTIRVLTVLRLLQPPAAPNSSPIQESFPAAMFQGKHMSQTIRTCNSRTITRWHTPTRKQPVSLLASRAAAETKAQ